MGNCVIVGLGEANEVIRVITSNGGVMEFSSTITAGSITSEFQGQAIFRSNDILGKPVFHHEQLLPGNCRPPRQVHQHHHVRSNSIPASLVVPYRMTCNYQPTLKRSHTDVFSRYDHHPGVWKVKLVITTEQLLEILSQEARTQELIEC
ncbi:uncharacterized protein LOC120196540 [Hibiscus syriacus]|uniref:uncharacterized protein LOC120196540 n=1 Tax=Hibiscus syriacus TaxID=106335 RepID=UPI0019237DE2|nr:uncharacterized protein LOC120196540 [Hibiscus syriacus]